MPFSALEELPEEALLRVVLFLGNVPDLLNCERTCKKLRSVVADDAAWKIKSGRFGNDPRAETNRKKVCMEYNCKRIRQFRREDSNLLLKVFEESPCQKWKTIVSAIMEQYLLDRLMAHHDYSLRGDAMFTLMELLQSYLTETFLRANLINTEASHELTLTLSHLKLQEVLGQSHRSGAQPCLFALFKDPTPAEIEFADSLIDLDLRDKIIRGTSFRAGVVKLDNEVYSPVWASAVKLIAQIFEQVCEELVYLSTSAAIQAHFGMKRKLPLSYCSVSNVRRVPPYATILFHCSECGAAEYLHVPVPRQIEEAARNLLPTMPYKVYGDGWLCDGDEECKQNDIEEAESHYEFTDESSPKKLKANAESDSEEGEDDTD